MDKSPVVHDEDLYASFINIGASFIGSTWLRDRARIEYEERDSFLNNEIENPKFVYGDHEPMPGYSAKLAEFNVQLDSSKAPAVVIDLYRKKVENQLLRNDLITASLAGDDESFMKSSIALYGKPHKKYFSYIAGRVLQLCDEQEKKHSTNAGRLRRLMSKINLEGSDIDVGVLPPQVKGGEVITSIKEVIKIFEETLQVYGVTGWRIVVDEGERSRFAVKRSLQEVCLPSEDKILARPVPLTDVSARALAEHEIGVHVRRLLEAEQGSLRLLELGFDSYLKGEEGLAGYVQQQVEGASEFYGFDRYLAASLAYGMDGDKRDFRSVFSLMADYYTLKYATENTAKNAPFQSAWDVCVRVFRGTTGQSAGYVFTKDIVYMEGNIKTWDLLSTKPQVFDSLFMGKFNPLLLRHVRTLQTLEILKEW